MRLRTFILPGEAMGKPRMTKRDRWAKRPVVERYHAYCDRLRQGIIGSPIREDRFTGEDHVGCIYTYIAPFPKSYSKMKRAKLAGTIHREKPDCDNIAKGIADALFREDSGIGVFCNAKLWDPFNTPGFEGILRIILVEQTKIDRLRNVAIDDLYSEDPLIERCVFGGLFAASITG